MRCIPYMSESLMMIFFLSTLYRFAGDPNAAPSSDLFSATILRTVLSKQPVASAVLLVNFGGPLPLLFWFCHSKYKYTLKMIVLSVLLTLFPLPGMIKTAHYSRYNTEYDNTLFSWLTHGYMWIIALRNT